MGAHLPHAVGAAYAAKVRGEEAAAMCWFGDGASSEGAAHEAMNQAAVASLPVVFLCENNGYAISVPLAQQMAVPSVAARAAGYGMAGATVDGTDAAAVHAAVSEAVHRARAGDGPTLLDLQVPRLVPHSSQDDEHYRTDEERERSAALDPLPRLEQEVLRRGLLDEQQVAALWQSTHDSVRVDVERALARPGPDAARARQWLFAGDPPHEYATQLDAGPLPPGVFRS